jgi:O-antigen/teichoic acid export membrane protein
MLIQIVLIGPAITKKTHFNSIINITGVCVNIGSMYWLIPIYGIIAVPISFLISVLIIFIFSWVTSEYLYRVGFSIKKFLLPFAMAVIVLFIVVAFKIELFYKVLLALFILLQTFILSRRNRLK